MDVSNLSDFYSRSNHMASEDCVEFLAVWIVTVAWLLLV